MLIRIGRRNLFGRCAAMQANMKVTIKVSIKVSIKATMQENMQATMNNNAASRLWRVRSLA
ncbi:hypothetical protein WKI13_17635 [Teredinibacter turnerae]|uniref:hypothetical protein n=1 Tax=Teredinibacter turnerae TaxID=2426 RepID=UPI000367B1CB|nr:hypothetical protein [Teredinibacter turnerae]